jgi:hypothetical protein
VTTHYDVLGVSPRASSDQIKRAYYRRARSYHPDAHAGSDDAVLDEAQRAMAGVNAAWKVLRDPRLRREYDRKHAITPAPPKPERPRRPPRLELGAGFHYWMGSSGAVKRTGERTRLNLVVDGARDLAPLQTLAPDRIFALHASKARIDDAQLRHLQGITGLQMLDLAGTAVTDAGMVHLLGLDRLEHLSLWDTAVSDAGAALLARMGSLRHLGLGNTPLTDAGLAALGRLADLRVLQLWGTAVSGNGLDHLHGLTKLEIVSLPWRVRGRHRRRLKAALPDTLVV